MVECGGARLGMDYCGRDKGMPNGRLYDREGMAVKGGQSLETRLG